MSKNPVVASKMSVAEIATLSREAADHFAPAGNWKTRVDAVSRAFGVGRNRAKEFYYSIARRVDAEEMDRARAAIKTLRAQREARQLRNSFRLVADRLRSIDPEFHRDTIAALERASLPAGGLDRA